MERQGAVVARAASRHAELPEDSELADTSDGAASDTTRLSRAPSLHPSVSGSTVSIGCSLLTIGAGDKTLYWDYQHRSAARADLGHRCRRLVESSYPLCQQRRPLYRRSGFSMAASQG